MRNAIEIQEAINSNRAAMDSLIQLSERENRDLTSKEAAQCDLLVSQVQEDAVTLATAKKLEGDKMARVKERFENHPGASHLFGSGSSDVWRADSKGNRYAVLSKLQKATDVYRPQCADEFSRFVLAKTFGVTSRTPDSIRNAMSTSDNSAGGFLVADQLSSQIVDLARSKSVLGRAGVTTILMQSGQLTIPALVSDVTISPKSENGPFQESAMQFGARTLNAKTTGTLVKLSRELFEDAEELLASQLTTFMAAEMARQVDEWGLNGAGGGVPLGLIPRAALLTADKINSTGSVGAIDWLDVSSASTAVRNQNHEPTSCVLNSEIFDDLMTIESGDGTNSARNWLGRPETLKDIQFLPTGHCPSGSLLIADFSRLAMGMRLGTRVEVSTEAGSAFEDHQVWLKIFSRIDFVPLDTNGFFELHGITT